MKGVHGHMHGTHNNSRRRFNVYLWTVILLLVFGGGILGVMGVHRLKDKRVFQLLLKEKHSQLLSLQHLLQKEREQGQLVKRKAEEMKVEIYKLRAQKMELNDMILKLQSTVSSLKDEQRTIELALQEKQNEAKFLSERYEQVKDQNPEIRASSEMFRHEGSELDDLKCYRRLDAKRKANESESETSLVNQNDERRENGSLFEGRRETPGREQAEKLEVSREKILQNGTAYGRTSDQVEPKENYDSHAEQKFETGMKAYETRIEDLGDKENKPGGVGHGAHIKGGRAWPRRASNSQGSSNQQSSYGGLNRLRGAHGYLKRAKGKRWRQVGDQFEAEKPLNQSKIQDLRRGSRIQRDFVGKDQYSEEDEQTKEQGTTMRQHMWNKNNEKHDSDPRRIKVSETNEMLDDAQTVDFEETDSGFRTSKESASSLEGGAESDRDETNDPEY